MHGLFPLHSVQQMSALHTSCHCTWGLCSPSTLQISQLDGHYQQTVEHQQTVIL